MLMPPVGSCLYTMHECLYMGRHTPALGHPVFKWCHKDVGLKDEQVVNSERRSILTDRRLGAEGCRWRHSPAPKYSHINA